MWTVIDSKPANVDLPELDEPLALATAAPTRAMLPVLGWSLLTVFLLTTLLLQALWWNRAAAAQHPVLRPWLDTVCAPLNCSLPPRQDLSTLHSQNLLIGTHADLPDVRVVDVTLQNRADFSQPAPSLLVEFSNTHRRTIAAALLPPSLYLSADQSHIMNPGDTLNVTVNLTDPGADAVNYRLQILAANAQVTGLPTAQVIAASEAQP